MCLHVGVYMCECMSVSVHVRVQECASVFVSTNAWCVAATASDWSSAHRPCLHISQKTPQLLGQAQAGGLGNSLQRGCILQDRRQGGDREAPPGSCSLVRARFPLWVCGSRPGSKLHGPVLSGGAAGPTLGGLRAAQPGEAVARSQPPPLCPREGDARICSQTWA